MLLRGSAQTSDTWPPGGRRRARRDKAPGQSVEIHALGPPTLLTSAFPPQQGRVASRTGRATGRALLSLPDCPRAAFRNARQPLPAEGGATAPWGERERG